MKKLVLFTMILLCAFTFDSSAQRKRKRTATSQGNWVLRVGAGFNTNSSTDELTGFENSSNTFSFNPTLSYMVIDNLEIGANVGVANTSSRNESSATARIEDEGTDFTFGLFAQKYFPLNNWFAFYTSANIGLLTGSGETSNINGSTTSTSGYVNNGVQGGLNFGFGFTPYNAFALYSDFTGLTISNTKRNPDGNTLPTVSNTSAGFNIARNPINIGIAWYFGRGLWRR